MTETVHTLAQVRLYVQLTMADVNFFPLRSLQKKILGKIGENSIVQKHTILKLVSYRYSHRNIKLNGSNVKMEPIKLKHHLVKNSMKFHSINRNGI